MVASPVQCTRGLLRGGSLPGVLAGFGAGGDGDILRTVAAAYSINQTAGNHENESLAWAGAFLQPWLDAKYAALCTAQHAGASLTVELDQVVSALTTSTTWKLQDDVGGVQTGNIHCIFVRGIAR